MPESRLGPQEIHSGHIVQVVKGINIAGNTFTNSTSYVDSGMNVVITPKFTTSRIIVEWIGNLNDGSSFGNGRAHLRFARNGTRFGNEFGTERRVGGGGNWLWQHFGGVKVEDSPGTISAVTYSMHFASDGTDSIGFAVNAAIVNPIESSLSNYLVATEIK